MEEHYLGSDSDLPRWNMYASVDEQYVSIEVRTDYCIVDSLVLTKEQALKLAELIKQKYNNHAESH